ncbi:inositol monophosphatase ImpA [Gordonia hirsuta DSM 44140 = NBRC 16056]|uniref:inositol-phosphate phosphatase n=1 Tax=Gordonia hirsuta DSM 44140 = NBRC 16056 TaxID=1121927 RepID=L7L7A7_9ACTN|nr:inositol monophosphatase family protein [Gordonia hirsuta]GAC55932.1 inositol monophosphatase ImpA [Gordonia hirsuta DSM 44140 = NBRC 16056]
MTDGVGLDLPGLLAVAVEILDAATPEFLAGAGAPSAIAKGGTDFATEMDLTLERYFQRELEGRTGIRVHGEEFGGPDPTAGAVWLVDPIDGTFNYSIGLPMTAMLVALVVDAEPVIGLTWVPRLGQRFAAYRGGPLLIDGQPATSPISELPGLHSAAIGYSSSRADARGIFPGAERAWVQDQIARRDARIRIHGCTGFDMAYVAAGHLAGAISYGRHPWDHAAGAVLVRAAGGVATDIFGRPWTTATASLVTGEPGVHAELLDVLSGGEWPLPRTLTFPP